MATHWSGIEGGLNPTTSGFTGHDPFDQAVLVRGDMETADVPSCVDCSLLAIFEDSSAPESKTESEEAILLSALTEMLGCEQDEEAAPSPFDTLPDSELLSQPDRCSVEQTSARRLRRRPKTPNLKLQTKSDRTKNQTQKRFRRQKQLCPESKEVKADVEVFSSSSLVSLVKLMHPYCLELHVEEEDGARKRHPLFSREEVWKFKQPAEDSDQEISVVSDEEEGGGRGEGKGLLLKSVLLNGNSTRPAPSRQRKRVSFGPVHVALFHRGEAESLDESAHLKSPQSVQSPAEPLPDPSQSSDLESDVQHGKSARKTRPLSLQEYRRRRREGRPLLEKRGNYNTKWPTLSEAPKELTPILCFQGHTSVCRAKKLPPRADTHLLSEAPQVSVLTPPQPEPKVSSPVRPDVRAAGSRRSLVKKPKLLSSDPPNPTLIPLQAPPPAKPPSVSRVEPVSLQEPDSNHFLSALSKDHLHVADVCPDPERWGEDKEQLDHPHTPEGPRPPQAVCKAADSAVDSGIEAADLTSLLQQFEQTQALGGVVCESRLLPAASLSIPPSENHLNKDSPAEPELTSRSLEPHQPPSAGGRLQDLLSWGSEAVLCTEVILSTKQKNSASKPIQIIDPRPLPPKKKSWSPPPPHKQPPVFFASDHDYCGLLDHQSGPPQFTVASSPPYEQWEVHDPRGADPTADEDEEEQIRVCGLPTPPPSPVRGRRRRRSPSCSSRSSSSSSCSSASLSPERTRHSSSSLLCSLSPSPENPESQTFICLYCRIHRRPPYRMLHSRSRSWSRSRSHSPSPQICWRRHRDAHSREAQRLGGRLDVRIQKLRAIDERRVVYVGRIRRSMTPGELRERFSQFGEVECVSLHFRDQGDHYGFVTFYNTEDAFAAIDNGSKLRRQDELPFDICFGGRRQFCSSDYSDLDASRDADPSPPQDQFEDLDFDALLRQAQGGSQR
ncbi:peroxisome proliferator-activated receptor gamma coactivator-related protein 1 isoform X2 [Oryzias latipes]|uniref:peroxisome proliferator-activated receptor gamma coactivator-related protein 1 isoform X2 n=1 Tax=Oryzias latipes TaxID=8090 RepID=UPI000CE22FD1|nr:peroxisome proliferator-activated receptor gamma coactivator-related protein 1 isoform X2 [Oryzias latipes]